MSTKARARRPHVIVWYRSKRGLSQGALAEAIGVSRDLIQKTERGTLPVSEQLAFKLAGYSGIHPEFFIDNRVTRPLPDLKDPQRELDKVIYSDPKYYETHLAQRVELLRNYLFSRAIVNELGVMGWLLAKFPKVLGKSREDHLRCWKDRRAKRWVGTKARAYLRKDAEEIARIVIADGQAILSLVRELKAKQKGL
jgi:transcriptional regulator with XRE-family HTH domain